VTVERRILRLSQMHLAIASICLMAIGMSSAFAQRPATADLSPASVTDIADPEQISHVIGTFQQQLRKLGFDRAVISCEHLVKYVDTTIGGHDYSFGGACTLSKGDLQAHILMCDDNLVGKFTLGGSDTPDKTGVVRFIRNNCPPGG